MSRSTDFFSARFKGQKDHLVYMVFLLPDRLTKAVFVYQIQGVLNETIQNDD